MISKNYLHLFLRTLRPNQWVKNLFVVAPVVFAKAHTETKPYLFIVGLFAGLVFSLLSGAVYVLNDILDAPKDRAHPIKRERPIASGELPVRIALILGLALLVLATIAGLSLGLRFALSGVAYLGLNVAYSTFLKGIAYLDVLVIAFGFLLRVVAGSFAIGLEPEEISYFLVACTFLTALYLALGKRRHELAMILALERHGQRAEAVRPSLAGYKVKHLEVAMGVIGLLAFFVYAFYTISPRTVTYFGTYNLVFSLPFVGLGLWRFWVLCRREKAHNSPTDALLRDKWFMLDALAWGILVLWAIYM